MPAPVNTVPPVVSGSTPSGNTLTTTNGTWTNVPTSFTYQWTKAGTNIAGATSATYVTLPSQVGTAIGVKVTATNISGSTTQASSNTITVTRLLSLCASVAAYLETVTSLSLNFDGAGTKNCFAGFIPDEPDQMVAVLERPGAQTLLTLTGPAGTTGTNQAQSLIDQPVIQLRTRAASGGYVTGNTLAQQAWGYIQGLNNTMLPSTGGMRFLLVTASSYPAFIGLDARQRPEWSGTLRCILENTQRVAA